MRVTVFGASGVQGSSQVRALLAAKHHPIAVSRSPKPLTVNNHQVETFAADFSDLPAIKASIATSDIIFLNLPSTSFQPADVVINAARNIGLAARESHSVKLIVFNTSMPVPDVSVGIEAQDHRRYIRDMLRHEMDLPVISIQPVVFLDNLLEGWAWPPIRDESTIRYCHYPALEVSWICHDDIGRLMISAMERPELAGRNFPVGGPETVRLPELAEKLSRAWGRELKVDFQSVSDFCVKIGKAMEARAGIDAEVLKDQMFRAYTWYNEAEEEPFKVDMEAVRRELPCELVGIEEWGRTHNPFK